MFSDDILSESSEETLGFWQKVELNPHLGRHVC